MVTRFTEGINKDINPKLKEYVSYCMGTVDQSTDGDLLSKNSEPGTTTVKEYPGYSCLGRINGDGEAYLFIKGDSDIILGVRDSIITEYLVEDLNFNNPIQVEFRVKNGCERILYFVDGTNPDRKVNLDKLSEYFIDGVFTPEKLNLAVITESIEISSTIKTDLDGSVEVGTYTFVVEALNSDLDVLYKTNESLAIPVFNKTKGYSDVEITGAYNIASADTSIGGIPKVSGSLEVTVDSFPDSFKYLRLIVIRKLGGDGLQRDAVRVGKLFTTKKLIYKGFTQEDSFIDVRDALLPFTIYDTSKEITQGYNRLIRGNLTESVYDWSGFQASASKIGAKFVVGEQATEKDTSSYVNGEGFMPDEVIPFGIKYRLKNGRTSPVFPIIGQCLNLDSNGNEVEIIQSEEDSDILRLTIVVPYITFSSSDFTYVWEISYVKDGVTITEFGTRTITGGGVFNSGGTDTFVIDTGNISDVNFGAVSNSSNLTLGDPQIAMIPINFNSNPINQNLPPAPLDGWDDTVYPTWNEDMSWFLTEDKYKELAGDLYGKMDSESLEALKDIVGLPKRYQIYNTAYSTSSKEGRLGYYQNTNFVYEQPECLEDFWGLDICGNPVVGTPIRHFRMPDRRLIPEGKIGIEFFNVVYPHPDVVSHEFVVAKLDENFVLDQGISSRMRGRTDEGKQEYGFSYIESQGESKDRDTWNAVFTPKTLQKEYQAAEYIKNLGLLTGDFGFCGINNRDTGGGNFEEDWNYVSKAINYNNIEIPSQINLKVVKNRFLDRLRYDTVELNTLINTSIANSISTIETDRILTMPSKVGVSKISLNTFRFNAYSNPLNLEYEKLHNNQLTENKSLKIYKGNIFHSEFQINNYMLTSRDGSFFRSLFGIGGSLYANLASVFTDVRKYNSFFYKNGFDFYAKGQDGIWQGDGSSEFHSEHLYNIFVDSTYNYKLNHSGESGQFKSFQLQKDLSTMTSEGRYNLGKGEDRLPAFWEGIKGYLNLKLTKYDETNNKTFVSQTPYGEPYNYNKDYNYPDLVPCYSFGFNYDFCSNCLNNFPNRYVFSPVSNLEDSQDLYRVTLANDFRDMTSNTGEITGLNIKNNQLIINTTYSSYIKPLNPQTLQTNEASVYVGTGDFLSLPETQFVETTTSYGGKQYSHAIISNEFGLQWADTINGQVFNYNGKTLEVLSDQDWMHWFKLNLPVQGEGDVHLTYDPYFKRLILTKNDILPDGENKSFTFAYSFLKKDWDSFQPYIPNLGFNNVNRLYSFNEGVYLHEVDKNFLSFYGKKYNMIVEVSLALPQTQFLDSINYVSDFEVLDGDRWEPVTANFTNLLAYNDFQSTGTVDIRTIDLVENPFSNIVFIENAVSCIKTDGNFKLANIWDRSSNQNLFSTKWEDLKEQFPIDKVPININGRGQYDLQKIKGKYVKVRLTYDPNKQNTEQDIKVTLHYLTVNNKLSIR